MLRFLRALVFFLILYDYTEAFTSTIGQSDDASILAGRDRRQVKTTPKPSRRRTSAVKKPKGPSKSELMCGKYAESVFVLEKSPVLIMSNDEDIKVDTCAINAEPLIFGGVSAEPREFPHMALIGYGENEENATWRCGGSLISDRFVLSAAHCDHSHDGQARWVRLGDLVITDDQDEADPVTVEIEEIIVHPDYTEDRFYNDILLFKLKDKVTFNPYVRPICLQTSYNITSKRALASGWGHTSHLGLILGTSGGRPPSNQLQKVTLNITDVERCNRTFRDFNAKLPQGINSGSMLCAGEIEGRDTCQGDSGGPLQIKLDKPYCMYSQIGIVSFGATCGSGLPAVYTRVSHFVPWIEKIVWPQ